MPTSSYMFDFLGIGVKLDAECTMQEKNRNSCALELDDLMIVTI